MSDNKTTISENANAYACITANDLKRNCLNCVHLGYEWGDVGDPEGYVCYKRDYYKGGGDSSAKESKHLSQLDKEKYRCRSKKCCEIEFVARPCSGCHETIDGHQQSGADYNSELMTYVGLGCDECFGHGYVLDTGGMG